MFKTPGGRSASLLATAVLIAAPAAVLLTAPAASAAPAFTGVEVCKSAANGMGGQAFRFTVSGSAYTSTSPLTVTGGSCTDVAVAAGTHTVKELASTGTSVQSIDVTPPGNLVSKTGRAVTVTVTKGKRTTVEFTNVAQPARIKVCKVAAANSPTLVGQFFSFTISTQNGTVGTPSVAAAAFGTTPICSSLFNVQAGSNVTVTETPTAGTAVSQVSVNGAAQPTSDTVTIPDIAAGVTQVVYTNQLTVAPQTGQLELCKVAGGPFVSGTIPFTVSGPGGYTASASVPVGGCVQALTNVPVGNLTVTENAPQYQLTQVTTDPAAALVSTNLPNQSAVVAVTANNLTVATFTDQARFGTFKICKALTSTSGALNGQAFTFNLTGTGVPASVSVVASSGSSVPCTLPISVPLGTQVTATEVEPNTNVSVSGIAVVPSAGSSTGGNTATFTVGTTETQVTYTNQAYGFVEACKNLQNAITAAAPFFPITIVDSNGTTYTRSVQAGHCTGPIRVPAGNATVSEDLTANGGDYHLVNTTVNGASVGAMNPVTVNVVYAGATANETQVTFLNAINTTIFKVCKTVDNPALLNRAYPFTSDAGDGLAAFSLTPTADPNNPGQVLPDCVATTVPVLNANLQPTQVTVTEGFNTGAPASYLNNVVVAGGTVSNFTNDPTTPDSGGSATVTVNGGSSNATVATFTNSLYTGIIGIIPQGLGAE